MTDECSTESKGKACCGSSSKPSDDNCPLTWFSQMISNCLDYAESTKAAGRPIIGITCEFTPRELIMAAGGVPVCLCGGDADTIPPAERDLPANLCPLIKSTYGYSVTHGNPFLEMADMIVVETTCDGKKKMYELLAETRPVHVLELPQKPDDADAFRHWVKELQKLIKELETRFNTHITPEKLQDAIRVMNQERRLRRNLAELMKSNIPPLTGLELLSLKSSISGIATDLSQYQRALEMLPGRVPVDDTNSRARVLLTGVPVVHGAERVVEIIEKNGGIVVCMENCTGLKPILDDVDESASDLLEAIAKKYFSLHCSVMTKNSRRIDAIRQLAADYRVDCVIDLIWQACLTYDVETHFVRRLVEDELGLPYMRIETDYSPSDTARLETRIEALFEMTRERKGNESA